MNQIKKTKVFTLFVVLIITTSIFSMLWVGMADHTSMQTCPVSSSSGGGCSTLSDSVLMSTHHIAGLQNMTTSILSQGTMLLVLFALLFLSIFFIRNIPSTELNVPKMWNIYNFNVLPKEKLLYWLVLVNRLNPHSLSMIRSNF